MKKKWLLLCMVLGISGCVSTGSGPGEVRQESAPQPENGAADKGKEIHEFARVVPLRYDETWEKIGKIIPTLVEPRSDGGKYQIRKYDKRTGIIEIVDFKYIGWKIPGAPKKEFTCRRSRDPEGKYLGILVVPSGDSSIVYVTTRYSQQIKAAEWVPQTISGRIDVLGAFSGTVTGPYQKSSARYDSCASTWAIENLVLNTFPKKEDQSPVTGLVQEGFFQFFALDRLLWISYGKPVEDVTEPIWQVKHEDYLKQATRKMRETWIEESRKGDRIAEVASVQLGISFAKGYGVARNDDMAAKWFKRVAAHNYIAQYNLGVMYLNGWGVPQNAAEAAEWFKTASMNCSDCVAAKNNLAVMYAQGVGVRKDVGQAMQLFVEILSQKNLERHICNVKTFTNLGYLFESGMLGSKDEVKAYAYYNNAALLGDPQAQKSKDLLTAKLTMDQITEASTKPEYQFPDCNPLWSGGRSDVP